MSGYRQAGSVDYDDPSASEDLASHAAAPWRSMSPRRRLAWTLITAGVIALAVGLLGMTLTPRRGYDDLKVRRYSIHNRSFEYRKNEYESALREVNKWHPNPLGGPPQSWVTQTFEREKIAEHMDYVSCTGHSIKGSGIPLDFGGLWWMDGNPAPEDVSSFGQGVWTPGLHGCRSSQVYLYSDVEKKRGIIKDLFGDEVPCRGRLDMDYFDERTWAWPYIPGMREIVSTIRLNLFRIQFVCGGQDPNFLTICKVAVPTAGAKYMAKVFPTDYYMVRVSRTLWIRYTPTPIGNHEYYLKQITDCAGHPVRPHWDQFNSGGWSKPEFQRDVFGHGGDRRWFVSSVPGTLYVRVNVVDSQCPKKTGTCGWFKSCEKSQNAICQEGECICGDKGYCVRNRRCARGYHGHGHRYGSLLE